MQIHELTQAKKLDQDITEGVFDTLKAAATWLPGESFAQAKAKVKNDAGVAKVAKKAQSAWQSYEQQLQKSIAQQPAKPTNAPGAPDAFTPAGAAKKPGTTGTTGTPGIFTPAGAAKTTSSGISVKTDAGNVVKGADGKWKSAQGEITVPADIAELERRAKKQATLAAQNKQMSAASGIKEAVAATTSPGGIAIPAGAKTAAPAAPAATPTAAPAQPAGALDAYKKRTDGRYEQALKAFVQQNLLAGMPYARLQNAQEIDQLIKAMSQPQNSDPKVQAPLWQQLALQAGVAAVVPQSAGGAGPEPKAGQGSGDDTQSQSARELVEPVQQTMKKADITTLAKTGQVLRSGFTDNETAIRSTGNPGVDAMLLAMGFTI